jgi:adenylate cyclase
MTEARARRKLSGILSADAVGYSRLMQEDEESTIRTLAGSKELMAGLIQQYRGRVVDAPGDNLLAEFGSVVDATECAVRIQQELKIKNADLRDDRKMDFRIGVNLGDVVEEGDRIYGDGVNIAARLEGLAEPGGICISAIAFDQVKNKLKLGYEYQGEHSVKNIAEPVRVYKALMEPEDAGKVIEEEKPKKKRWRWAALASAVIVAFGAIAIWHFYFRAPPIEPASVERMAFPLPDKPSIAVLPFDNLSGDSEQDYIADGFSENIITALSSISQMFVIARNSSFTYKGKPVKVQQVSEELGVRYILEGSIMKSGEKVRITAQLIDALTGGHIWSERYDRDFNDLLNLLDEITLAIAVELQVELTEGEQARIITTDNLDAWLYVQKGKQVMYTSGNTKKARELYDRALEIDPEYTGAITALAWTHFWDARYGLSDSRRESFRQAVELAKKSVALDDNQPAIHALLGYIYLYQKQYNQAIEEGRKSIALDPSSADLRIWFGEALYRSGIFEEAVQMCEEAMRLHPHTPLWYLGHMMNAYYWVGRYEESLATAERLVDLGKAKTPKIVWWGYWGTARAKVRLGRESEAREDVAKLLKLRPEYSLELDRRNTLYKPALIEREHEDMRKAGFPEHPPLKLPDKPSIAVLAFVNLSGDPEQEYFSDGVTEEIITALSKTPKLFIIARTSSFKYKGKEVDVRTVGRELGVKYVLEGSVRKAGDKVRITAQLIDAKTNNHIWAERYDRDLKDIFALQDEITLNVLKALDVKLIRGEEAKMFGKGVDSLELYTKVLQARNHLYQWNREGIVKSRKLTEEIIRMAPQYATAYQGLAGVTMMEGLLGMSKSRKESLMKAIELCKKAISLDDSLPGAHGLLGFLYVQIRQYDKGIAECEKALELAPNSADAHSFMAQGLNYSGRPEEAIAHNDKAFRLNPMGAPTYYYGHASLSYFLTGRYEDTIKVCKEALKRWPNNVPEHAWIAMAYMALGREEEARNAAQELLRMDPKFSAQRFAQNMTYKDSTVATQALELMNKAGLK